MGFEQNSINFCLNILNSKMFFKFQTFHFFIKFCFKMRMQLNFLQLKQGKLCIHVINQPKQDMHYLSTIAGFTLTIVAGNWCFQQKGSVLDIFHPLKDCKKKITANDSYGIILTKINKFKYVSSTKTLKNK